MFDKADHATSADWGKKASGALFPRGKEWNRNTKSDWGDPIECASLRGEGMPPCFRFATASELQYQRIMQALHPRKNPQPPTPCSKTSVIGTLLLSFFCCAQTARACCPVSAPGVPAVNADQTVIMVWDRERQTQHFIRKASFLSEGDSVGFIVPTPSRPQLAESGNQAFQYLAQITARHARTPFQFSSGCSTMPTLDYAGSVRVIEEKTVAGYDAVVLAADSGNALVAWLQDHGYAFTADVAAWAQPYLDQRWYMTAMKIAKDPSKRAGSGLKASALRITFQTDRPLFPYREPDPSKDAALLHARDRLLRIYFVAEARYKGGFGSWRPWSGKTKWSQPLQPGERSQLLKYLGLPENTGPATAWLTEFEDNWPYSKAPGDVYFSKSGSQRMLSSKAAEPFDPTLILALGAVLIAPYLRKRRLSRQLQSKTKL